MHTLRRIRNGHFDQRVQVFSNDEIGYTGDAINEMTKGLIERERMQQSLNLAKEVQQNLLPKSNLNVNGFDPLTPLPQLAPPQRAARLPLRLRVRRVPDLLRRTHCR